MVDFILAAGIIGTAALVIAWIWETHENIKKRKVDLHMHFSLLYIAGNAMLTLYSYWINNMVFLVLGLFLLIAIISETIYAMKIKRPKRK